MLTLHTCLLGSHDVYYFSVAAGKSGAGTNPGKGTGVSSEQVDEEDRTARSRHVVETNDIGAGSIAYGLFPLLESDSDTDS